jgi:hypothetical protein
MSHQSFLNCSRRLFRTALAALAVLFSATLSSHAASLGNYQSHVTNSSPAGIEITDALGNHLRFRAYGTNMIRVQAATSATFSPDDRYLMIENHYLGGALSVISTGGMIQIPDTGAGSSAQRFYRTLVLSP